MTQSLNSKGKADALRKGKQQEDSTQQTVELDEMTEGGKVKSTAELASLSCCPLPERREKIAREVFAKLDKDGNGALSKEEFMVLASSLDPGITMEGVDKAFKRARIENEMDLQGFFKWASKMYRKVPLELFL